MFSQTFIKRYFLLFVCLLVNQIVLSQSLTSKLEKYCTALNNRIPADQVFLHSDRNLYHPGDTVRFQAYIRDWQTGIFETKSISLFVLLINSDHITVDSARFRIANSLASGWLRVPDEIPFGDYSILSFTSNMINYDPKYIFTLPIRIDKLRPPNLSTNNKSEKDKLQTFEKQKTNDSIDLRFLPEGGTFIYGIKQRLAFNALSSFGSQIFVEGDIVNQKNEKICDFKSGTLGPGMLEFIPIIGNTYSATLHGNKYLGLKWPLPLPEKSGVTLRVNSSDKGMLNIGVSGKNSGNSSYLLTLIMNNILVLSKELKIDSTFKIKISTEELPTGTAYVTLFNNDLRPVAERLVYLNSHKQLNIGVTTDTTSYNRGAETELILNSTDNNGKNISALVSVSVIDSVSGFYGRFPYPYIENFFLFDRDFYDNLPSKLKLNGLVNTNENDIDLLLLTYGWRRFLTEEQSDTSIINEFRNYDFLKIKNPAPDKKARNEVKVINIEGLESISLKLDQNHEATLRFDSLGKDIRQIMIMPDKNSTKNVYPLKVEFQENKDFTNRAKQFLPDSRYFETDSSAQKKIDIDFGLDSAIIIDPITIRGAKKSPIEYSNKYQKQYQSAHLVTITSSDLIGCQTFEDVLMRLNLYRIDTKNKLIYVSANIITRLSGSTPALIVLDDTPLFAPNSSNTGAWKSSYESIAELSASQISSVTVVKGVQGFVIYGQDALGGVVFVETKAKANQMVGNVYAEDAPGNKNAKDDNMKPIRIFRSEVEYYTPKKEEVITNPEYQFRPTVLWKNEVFLDGNGPLKIKYPNNMVKGTIIVIINGVSFTNLIGSTSYKYLIK